MSGVSKKIPLPHWQKLMDEAGWSNAQDVARATGLPNTTIARVINGEVTPSYDTVNRIARAASISPHDILVADFNYKVGFADSTAGITQ